MERFLQKDQVLLGYSTRRSSCSPKIPLRNSSDVDFNDVFGGPPRRSSIQDWRHSSSVDSKGGRGEGEEDEDETSSSRDAWSGLGEKPVFGEEILNRKRYPSDDFFDDIFRGDESSSSTPIKPGRDPFSSNPGSRVQSPARSMLHSDPFASSSLPPVLSPPTRLAKEIDSPALSALSRSPHTTNQNAPSGLGFPSSPSMFASRFSTQVIQGQEGMKSDMRYNYRRSSSSKEVSLSSDGSSQVTKSDKHSSEGLLKTSSEDNSSTQFHFSIYKWASTKIPIAMPLREGNISSLKGWGKFEKIMNEFPAPVLEGTELRSSGDNTHLVNKPFEQNCDNRADNSFLNTKKDTVDPSKVVEEVASPKPESKPLSELIFKELPTDLSSQNADKEIKRGSGAYGAAVNKVLAEGKEKKTHGSKKKANKSESNPLYCLLKDESDREGHVKPIDQARVKLGKVKSMHTSPREGTGKTMPVSKKKAQKPELDPLYCLLSDDSDRQGFDKANEQARAKLDKSLHTFPGDVENVKKGKKQTEKMNVLNVTKENNSSLKDLPVSSEEKLVGNKVKGKVKDFVKIFNRQPSSKSMTNVEAPDQSAIDKDGSASRAEDQASACPIKVDGKGKLTNTKTRISDFSASVDRIPEQPEKPHFGVNTAAPKIYGTPFERDDGSASCSGTIPGSATVNAEESHFPDLDCTVKDLSHDQDKQALSGQNPEDLQVWDAKIRQWSNGKEGNIRSLLSTLQYVLWPESGWKPVPLVDIIEGNPVKRAYQKAMLCLHPDKLQQKGAAPHQKYIAEKVFDILQDAWTHFNSLNSF